MISLPQLRYQLYFSQCQRIEKKLIYEALDLKTYSNLLKEFIFLLEKPYLLPMDNIQDKLKFQYSGYYLLQQILSNPDLNLPSSCLSQLAWARLIRMGESGNRNLVSPEQESSLFLFNQRLEQSLSQYQGLQHASILRLVTHSCFFPQLNYAIEQGQFYPFSKMPLSSDLIQADAHINSFYLWRAQTQHSLIGYVATHTHHPTYLRSFLNQTGGADQVLITDNSLEEYQLTFLQHLCQEALGVAVGKTYLSPYRLSPLSLTQKVQLALEFGANPHFAYGARPSPWEWIAGAIRYPDLKNPVIVQEIMDIFENHQLRMTLKKQASTLDVNLRETQRL